MLNLWNWVPFSPNHDKTERVWGHWPSDQMSVQSGDKARVVSILVDKLQILVGNFDFVLRNFRWELRREDNLLSLLLLPHPSLLFHQSHKWNLELKNLEREKGCVWMLSLSSSEWRSEGLGFTERARVSQVSSVKKLTSVRNYSGLSRYLWAHE